METRQTWGTIREIGLCNTHKNTSCQIDPNDLNKSFVNTSIVRADPNFYSFHCDHAYSDIGGNMIYPSKTSLGLNALRSMMSCSIRSDNMHHKFIRIILPLILPFITHLFNTVIMCGMYPMKWKHAKIVPVRKSNGDYRPMASLCFLSKVLEKILYMQMMNYMLLWWMERKLK